METDTIEKIKSEKKLALKGKSLTEFDLSNAKLLLPPKLVHLTNEEGWHLFYDPENHVWVRLNDSGKEIIQTIGRLSNLDEVIGSLAFHYGLRAESIRDKVVDFIRDMIDAGIVHPNDYISRKFSFGDDHPVNVYYSNTERCNLSCVYCYNAESRKSFGRFRDEMTTAESMLALDKFRDFGATAVAFCGGEPLVRHDMLEVARYAKDRGFRIALITNGTLITETLAPVIADLFDLVWVSLDSHIKEEHEALRGRGSFDRTMRAVKMLAKYKPNMLVVNSVVCNINVKSMPEMHKLMLEEIGVSQHRLGAFMPSKEVVKDKHGNPISSVLFDGEYHKYIVDAGLKLELGGDELPALALDKNSGLIIKQAPMKNQCGFANGDIHMVSNGDIYPCAMMYKKEFRAGNILAEDIRKIYRDSDVMKKCRAATVDSIKECSQCAVKYVCAGGCRATAYEMYGDLKAYHKDLCHLLKKNAEDNLWLDTKIPFDKMEQAVGVYKQKLKEIGKEKECVLSESQTM